MIVTLPATYAPVVGSSMTQDLGVATDQADDYTQYTRALSDVPWYDLDVRFVGLTRSEHQALAEFMGTNRQNEILMTLDGITYRLRPAGQLSVRWRGGLYADCAIKMRGVVHG
jgi:hypothetical protein